MKYKDSNGNWQTIKVKNYGIEQTPIGSMIYYPSQNIPAGYLVCDGSEKLIADYPLLFNAIGYIGGEDVAVGYFRLPDMRGAVPGGYNSTLSSGNPLYGQFGDQVGAPTHQLTIDEMPRHNHPQSLEDGGTRSGWASYNWSMSTTSRDYAGSDLAQYTGGNQPHSIVQPTKLYHWLIKAKNVVTLGGYTEDFEVRGSLEFLSNRFFYSKGQYAINLNNSDIINANAIYFNDSSDSGDEGFNFLKSGATPKSDNPDDYDNLRVLDNSLILNNVKVVESGSNENGSWTKWSDGTMICRNKVDNIAIEIKQNMSNKNIIYYGYVNDGWTYFPQEFIEPPTTILNLNTSSNCFGIQPYALQYSDRPPGFYPLSVDPTLTGVISISYIAIGKWK